MGGGGYWLFRFFGVGADWLIGNLWRSIRHKHRKTYKEIWNGDTEDNYMDNAGYNVFYVVIGIFTLVAVIFLLRWLFLM